MLNLCSKFQKNHLKRKQSYKNPVNWFVIFIGIVVTWPTHCRPLRSNIKIVFIFGNFSHKKFRYDEYLNQTPPFFENILKQTDISFSLYIGPHSFGVIIIPNQKKNVNVYFIHKYLYYLFMRRCAVLHNFGKIDRGVVKLKTVIQYGAV